MTGIIITGGKSQRLQKDKATFIFNSKALAQYSSDLLKTYCEQIIVASNNINHSVFGDIRVQDEIGDGPIAGLYSGLKASSKDWNLILPCDTPYINDKIIDELISNKEDFDAIVAVDANNKVHPLIGIYHRRIITIIQDQINNNKYSVMNLLEHINTKYVKFNDSSSFRNLNTIKDINEETK